MPNHRKAHHQFRPSLHENDLEERVVPSTLASARVENPAAALGVRTPALQGVVLRARLEASLAGRQAAPSEALAHRQLERAFLLQARTAQTTLVQEIRTAAQRTFTSGRPTAQQLADFNAAVAGAVDATTFQLSSSAALLPGGAQRLAPAIQQSLLAKTSRGLVGRLQALSQSPRLVSSATVANSIGRQVSLAFSQTSNQLRNFFTTTPMTRLSVDQNGQQIPIQQFMAGQVMTQFGNSLGSFAQAFPMAAQAVLFPGSAMDPTPAKEARFLFQASQALGLPAFELGTDLTLFPNSAPGLFPDLQTGFFGTGSTSLNSGLQGLTSFTNPGLTSTINSIFNTGFQNMTTSLNTALSLTSTGTGVTLPTGPFTGGFTSDFSTFGNGFNNGFGSGFTGLGNPSASFNPNFDQGFFDIVNTGNTGFGFGPVSTTTTSGTGTTIGIPGSTIGPSLFGQPAIGQVPASTPTGFATPSNGLGGFGR